MTALKLRTVLIPPCFYLYHSSLSSHTKKLLQHICLYVVYNFKIFFCEIAVYLCFLIIFLYLYLSMSEFFLSMFLSVSKFSQLWLLGICIPNSKKQCNFSFSNSSRLVSLLLYHELKVFSALCESRVFYILVLLIRKLKH